MSQNKLPILVTVGQYVAQKEKNFTAKSITSVFQDIWHLSVGYALYWNLIYHPSKHDLKKKNNKWSGYNKNTVNDKIENRAGGQRH